ncbi:MAG TPA: hypothetical protein VGS11_04035 [Candidatus Bathyarchaeia archaeon]|nr:hypothetical protein [Candidatus Bathyarchaeia archaeon]
MQFAKSGIDTPLKVSSIFGVIIGALLLSSLATVVPTLSLLPVDHSSPFPLSLIELLSIMDAVFVILGGLVVLSARVDIERRGVLAFFVFVASLFAMFGSLGFLSFLLRPQ